MALRLTSKSLLRPNSLTARTSIFCVITSAHPEIKMDTRAVSRSEMRNFSQDQGQFRRKAELDSSKGARRVRAMDGPHQIKELRGGVQVVRRTSNSAD
jgi:hypothetical protein